MCFQFQKVLARSSRLWSLAALVLGHLRERDPRHWPCPHKHCCPTSVWTMEHEGPKKLYCLPPQSSFPGGLNYEQKEFEINSLPHPLPYLTCGSLEAVKAMRRKVKIHRSPGQSLRGRDSPRGQRRVQLTKPMFSLKYVSYLLVSISLLPISQLSK